MRCADCKYIGPATGRYYGNTKLKTQELHLCENRKSMFKECLTVAMACTSFESKESSDADSN